MLLDLRSRLNLLRLLLLFTLFLTAYGLFQFARPVYESGLLFSSLKWQVVIGLGLLTTVLVLGMLPLTWTSLSDRLLTWSNAGLDRLQRLKWLNFGLFFALVAGFSFLLVGPFGAHLLNIYPRLALFWLVALLGSVLLRAGGVQRSWAELLGAAVLFTIAGYKIAAYLPDISAYPFTLGWSEASRYYYASLYFSERIYGLPVPPTVLHPSRYLMQAVPFLIPDSPLWLHRLWQVVLWISTAWISAWLLARRLSIPDSFRRWLFIAWAFLFLFLGPVYYHLLVPVILVLWGFDRRRFWKSLVVILLASAWAGISRVNWFPVPGMLGAALYFLETPVAPRSLFRYLAPPVLWAVSGLLVAFGAQALYAIVSGNPAEQFTSSFSSDLLWYRLFPNITYPLGILPAILLVSLPLFLLIGGRLAGVWRSYHPIRLLGLAAILLVLFTGGLVVSTKIGGGSNLHNLDAYLVLLLVIAAYYFFGEVTPEQAEAAGPGRRRWSAHWAFDQAPQVYAILLVVFFTLPTGSPVFLHNPAQTQEALETIRDYVSEAVQQGGEVLFITERQLVTFHMIGEVELVPEYEKVFLMEMAMAGNPDYLGKFHAELENHRFALIVSEPLFTRRKGSDEIFGEENNAWVQQVSKPVLCYYRPKRSLLTDFPIQLLIPRAEPLNSSCP